ncbi:hypothetical protein [Mesonia phycicola]|uniref:hypothetical protein n=1 Tax=Mesonia phycicola TaxID=579105 RepID=UPI001160D19F|nr:hypothetical protein [Mesonia phycicola]
MIGICSTVNAQKISKYFTSSMQDNGVLYFIEPKQEFENDKEDSSLFYDLTYLTSNDTVTFNFTYVDKKVREIDSITFVLEDNEITIPVNKIFIESSKNVWKHRYSAKFLFEDLTLIFQQKGRASLLVHYEGEEVKLKIKQKKWDKQSKILSKILYMIKANRKEN